MYYPLVVIVSLESSVVMTFRKKLLSEEVGLVENKDIFSVLLQPRSVFIFSGDAYAVYMHGIDSSGNARCDSEIVIGATAPCINKHLCCIPIHVGHNTPIANTTDPVFTNNTVFGLNPSRCVQDGNIVTREKRVSLTIRHIF